MSNVKIINMYEFAASSSLATRQIAREISNYIANSSEKMILLDFTQIEFASRSFFDELNNAYSKFNLLGKKIEFNNLNESLSKLFNLVRDAAKSKSSFTYSSVANAQVIKI